MSNKKPFSRNITHERTMRKQTIPRLLVVIIAIFLLYYFSYVVQSATPITFSQEYGGPFNKTHYDIFKVIDPALISNGALQLTPDSPNSKSSMSMSYNSARILLKQPFRLWEEENDNNGPTSSVRVASFNTSFLINVFRIKNDTSEGLAFVIAPDLLLPPNSFGQFLGLTNSMTDNRDSNKLVAVELDTFKQYFDPDDNHVGIDVNSVVSVKTESLTKHNITIAPVGTTKFHNIWVDYDGFKMVLDVYIAEQVNFRGETPPKPEYPVLSADLNLRDHVNQHSYFGFSASNGNDSQLYSVLRWNLNVHHFFDPKTKFPKSVNIMRGAGPAVLVVVMLLLLAAVWFGYCFYKNRVAALNGGLVAALRLLPGTPREFKFKDLKKSTNNFDEKNKLGQGGFGVVYKGTLVEETMEIAVKWFSRESIKGQHDFLAELTIINRLRHKHLVKLLGWCHKNGKLLLVYEYMPNGSLDQHLFVGLEKEPLEWNLRHKIISGVASALHYLHNEYDQKVVHRDLKASNIMLDSDFNARLGDFGLARALEKDKTFYLEAEGIVGTMGYIAPECFLTGKATKYSDVYAFGAVLLEVVCGQRPGIRIAGFQFLVDWVWMMYREGKLLEAVDSRLGDSYIAEEAESLLLLGLACSHPNGGERPKTEAILQMVLGMMAVPDVPPFRPAFVWAAPGSGGEMGVDSVNTMSITVSDFAR